MQGEINLYHGFYWIHLILCIHNVDSLNICMKKYDAKKIIFDKMTTLKSPSTVLTAHNRSGNRTFMRNIQQKLWYKLISPRMHYLNISKTRYRNFRFCWTISPNVGQTHKENPNLVRILICTLNDIYKQYNKLREHWYTKISSLRCVKDRNPPQNASDLYMKYWSYAEHCRPCTRLSGVNWWKKKH